MKAFIDRFPFILFAMKESDEVHKLIRLKRYEKPHDGYFEQFLTEFHGRQRSELLKRSAHGIFCERVATY
ncbi:MAG: hypothetical protein ACC661_09575, partial [Verrucomicrobiales bacterium]